MRENNAPADGRRAHTIARPDDTIIADPPASHAVQDRWLATACGTRVRVRLTDGATIAGTLARHDRFTLELRDPHQPPTLIYKHAIATLTPAAANGGAR